MQTKPTIISMTVCAVILVSAQAVAAPVGTAFTYQGQLKAGGIPADGEYDFLFQLFDCRV